MGKLEPHEISLCEMLFGHLEGILALKGPLYGRLNEQGKASFWLNQGRRFIADNGFEVPSFLLWHEAGGSDIGQRYTEEHKLLCELCPSVKAYAVIDDKGERGAGAVGLPLASALGPHMRLPRRGRWVRVEYQGNDSTGRVDFLRSQGGPVASSGEGIYTTEIGGCSCVAVLYGNREAGSGGKSFATATLAHFDGSNPSSIDWNDLKPFPGWHPVMAKRDGRNVKAVVFADSAISASLCIEPLFSRIGVWQSDVTVYLSYELSRCGFDRTGAFGITLG